MLKQHYDTAFFDGQASGSARSAAAVVPILTGMAEIHSVVDVGCGIGTWLEAFAQAGISDYTGIDGTYIAASSLRIPADRFVPMNLREPAPVGRRYDLACSLEVAEHLPAAAAERFVAMLVGAAPMVMFSAAIPGQGGMDHINEQWQSYWARLFRQNGYEPVDCIRPLIHADPTVEWWYKQNILIYCAPGHVPSGQQVVQGEYGLDQVHPQLIDNLRAGPHSGRESVVAIQRGTQVLLSKLAERLAQRFPRGSRRTARPTIAAGSQNAPAG